MGLKKTKRWRCVRGSNCEKTMCRVDNTSVKCPTYLCAVLEVRKTVLLVIRGTTKYDRVASGMKEQLKSSRFYAAYVTKNIIT